ncbi:MAG: stage II sporulation protein P [Oscillospiraceae bacterium]|nr:stage II sporulation protein P [Oscillospiraceae bacterium]
MNDRKKVLRLGAYMGVCLLVWMLSTTGIFDPVVKLLTSRTVTSVILFLETGHVLRDPQPSPSVGVDDHIDPPPTSPETTILETTGPPPTVPVFSPSDAELVDIHSYCGYEPDVPAWLEMPLTWNLKQAEPTVLILHSHATESYENTEGYKESSDYRTLDEHYNMVSVGEVLATLLEENGIRVIHDKSLHDSPSYSDSYGNSRVSAQKYLEQYPSISLILDLHRDSVADSDGDQIKYTVDTPIGTVAQMMLVVGTDAGGLTHTKWPENMSLAVKLQAHLEKQCPGICRPISFRTQRFNQDLSTGALLVEMGSAGNDRQEALLATQYLAKAIIDLAAGTE